MMPSGCNAQGYEIQAGRRAHSQPCSLGEEAGAGDHDPPRADRPASYVEDYLLRVEQYLRDLREQILAAFEAIEGSRFERQPWSYSQGSGGGETALIRGRHFEKAAVHFSSIQGEKYPLEDAGGPFHAMGVSCITHMASPHVPTAHFNLRAIQAGDRFWLGGGYDLTPMGFPYAEDTGHFHAVAQEALAPFGCYEQMRDAAARYFFLPHRQKERGVGGLFFDHLNSGCRETDLALWRAVGNSFLPALLPILERRLQQPFTAEERATQLQMRGHYVEFNLLYDRGTRFGLQAGGHPDAIFGSLPPVVSW
jgi:coproporphyrinogen III oxidase